MVEQSAPDFARVYENVIAYDTMIVVITVIINSRISLIYQIRVILNHNRAMFVAPLITDAMSCQ